MISTNHKRYNTVAALLLGAATVVAQLPFELDMSFRTYIQNTYVSSVVVMENGQLLLAGEMVFQGEDPFVVSCGARLNSDGSRDALFPLYPSWGCGIGFKQWNDQYYVDTHGLPRRLLPMGSVDPSFQHLNDNAPLFSSVQGGDYHVYPDGSIVITGSHTMNVPDSGWVGSHHMIWFNNDGTLDFTRRPRKGNGAISLIVPQPDGKFLLSGASTTWEGVPKPNLFRVHADGTLDTTFTSAMGWGTTASMTVLEDGRILVSGLLKTMFSSPDTLNFVRLLPDGGLDPSFNNDLEVVTVPWSAPLWPDVTINWGQRSFPQHTRISDGRIVLHGSHYIIEGQERLGIAMLDADGNLLDEPFGNSACGRYYYEPYGFLYGSINGFMEAPDGSFYIWGAYKGYDDGTTNDPTQRFVSRLHGLNVGIAERERIAFKLYPNPASTQLTVELEELPTNVEVFLRDALGREVLRQRVGSYQNTIGLHGLGSGVYVVELWSGAMQLATEKLIVQP